MKSHFNKMLAVLLILLALSCSPSLSAQIDDADTATRAKCGIYLNAALPTEALAIAIPKSWPGCDSIHSYSGIGQKVNFAAARQCAWRERLAQQANLEPRYSPESLFGGSAMLAVLYANGEGVEQNKQLAMRFACESALNDQGLAAVAALPDMPHISENKFRYCDYGFTTFEMNFCAQYQNEITERGRQDALDALSKPWPQAEKEAFATLRKAAENYAKSHGENEAYRGGTIRYLRENGVEERQRDKFVAAVRKFEAGQLPTGTEGDFRSADLDLNMTYKKLLELAAAQNFAEDDGDIHPEDIRKAEGAWLQYRDAWVAFARIHYRQTNPYSWLTLLTRNRCWSLRQTMCTVGWSDPACKRPGDNP